MHSPARVQQQQHQHHLKLDTTDSRQRHIPERVSSTEHISKDSVKPEPEREPAFTAYPDIDCFLLLLRAKITLESGAAVRERYQRGGVIAKQALDLATAHRLPELVARSFFYLAESVVIDVKRGPNYRDLARKYYTCALDCSDESCPEVKRAKARLAELDTMFPTSASYATSSAVSKWISSFPSRAASLVSLSNILTPSMHYTKAEVLAEDRDYQQLPIMDTPASEKEATIDLRADGRTQDTSADCRDNDLSIDGASPGSKESTGTIQHRSSDRESSKSSPSRSISVTSHKVERSPKTLTQRRELSRSLTISSGSRRSDEALMEEGKSPIRPGF